MILEIFKSFFLIFLAEMGDKTQIMAMTFATKYKIRHILIGVAIGAALNHGIAILLGTFIMKNIQFNYVFALAGIIFIIFGILSLGVSDEDVKEEKSKFGGIITVAIAFFIGELGDKTQLAALTLASSSKFPVFVLVGTVLGMVFTSFIGIIVGKKFGSKIPEFKLKIGASIIFIIFGFEKLISSELFSDNLFIIPAIGLITLGIYFLKYKRYKSDFERFEETIYLKQADILKKYFLRLDGDLKSICLGENVCMSCDGKQCAVGYMKNLVGEILVGKISNFDKTEVEDLLVKNFDKEKSKALLEYMDSLEYDSDNKDIGEIIFEIKSILKYMI